MNQELIDQVLEQIKRDVEMDDMTAIEELIKDIQEENLNAYLPE